MKKLIDTRIDAASSLTAFHDVIKGGANIASQEFKAISASTSNIDFVIQTPGLGVYMSRRVNMKSVLSIDCTVACVGTSDKTIRWGRELGVGAFPLNSLITNATVQINTSNFNTQVGQNMGLWKRLYQKDGLRATLPEVPTGIGHTAIQYIHGNSGNTQLPQPQTSASSWPDNIPTNPNTYEATIIAGTQCVVNGDGSLTLTAGQTATFTVHLTVVEPLLIQPFSTDDEEPAFINVNVMTVRLNLANPQDQQARPIRLAFMPDGLGTSGGTSCLRFVSQAFNTVFGTTNAIASTLRCQFITPPATDQIPTKTIYPTMYYNPLSTRVVGSTIVSGQLSTLQSSNVITLNTAPDMIAIYAVPEFSAAGMTNAAGATQDGNIAAAGVGGYPGALMEDTMLAIESLQIQWNNNPSLLATFDKYDLYRRTRENGLDMPWYIFNGFATDADTNGGQVVPVINAVSAAALSKLPRTTYDVPGKRATIGMPVLLALNKDIPVEPGVGAGVAGVYTLSVKAVLKNQLPFNVTAFTLYVVPINSQYLILNAGATSDVISTIATEQVVASAPVSGEVQNKGLLGGSRRSMHPHATASSRRPHQMGRLVDGGPRGMSAPGGAGASQYVGAKRPHYG